MVQSPILLMVDRKESSFQRGFQPASKAVDVGKLGLSCLDYGQDANQVHTYRSQRTRRAPLSACSFFLLPLLTVFTMHTTTDCILPDAASFLLSALYIQCCMYVCCMYLWKVAYILKYICTVHQKRQMSQGFGFTSLLFNALAAEVFRYVTG